MPATIASAKTGNNLPAFDGDVNLYESPEGKVHQWWDKSRKLLFINGMDNSDENHRASALALSLVQNCKVVGIFNASGGKIRDLAQCAVDKITWPTKNAVRQTQDSEAIAAFIVHSFRAGAPSFNGALAKYSRASRIQVMRDMLGFNPATVTLFDLLLSDNRRLPIFAHSQGNLIACNALRGLVAIGEESLIAGRPVHSFGSPTSFWPGGIEHHNYAFMFDPVTYLSVGDVRWFTGGNITAQHQSYFAHGFLEYMKYDAEFVINRFRIRNKFSLSKDPITLSMDEEGLAKALVDMGGNFERIHSIVQRLYDKHNADSDDVAGHYVRKLQATPQGQAVANRLKQMKPDLVKLLIKCLDEGWTTGHEYDAIAFLKK